ncbi:MAG: HigA family addiction module antidote protein [Gammaproteobacteria bacterium]|nr:HigA family addiction module antidote protein [Gammaproteobacteria bacterium]
MPMHDPAHPGEIIRESMEAVGWSVAECADQLRISRGTMSRLLNGRSSITPRVALALEEIGWSNAEFWLRVQSGYDLARERKTAA